ncbi:LOW QUALITY PROTEIN: spermatogenesis-associated protein 31D4-like [Hipposideros larvatus]
MGSSFLCSNPGCSFVPPISCSPQHWHHDATHLCQQLHTDPFCQASFGGDPAANLVGCCHLLFLSPDILAFPEGQVQKIRDFLMWKGKGKKSGSFLKQLRPDYHLNSSGKMFESDADQHDSVIALPFWSSKGRRMELHVHQQPSQPQAAEDYLAENHIQLFFGFPIFAQGVLAFCCPFLGMLCKQQERLWGLPSVVQRSWEDLCCSALNSAYRWPPQAQVSISILPGEFPLSNELCKTLEHYLQKGLIQRRWGLPHRIHESRPLMRPPSDSSELPEPGSNDLSWISVHKGRSRKTLNVGLSQPRSFYERGSEMLQLEKDKGNSPENGPKDHLLSDSENSSDKDLVDDSEDNLKCHRVSLSGENTVVSGQRQLEKVLKVHSNNKSEKINEGRQPGTVHSARHAVKQTLTLSVKSHTGIKQRSLPPSGAGSPCERVS